MNIGSNCSKGNIRYWNMNDVQRV